jgi:hypothetical protein
MKEEQHIVDHQTPSAQYFRGGEVSTGQDILMGGECWSGVATDIDELSRLKERIGKANFNSTY